MHIAIGGNPWAIARKNATTSSIRTRWLWCGVRIASGAKNTTAIICVIIRLKVCRGMYMQTISVPTEKGKTMREKLMEIVCDALEDGCVVHCNHPHCNKVKNVADNLISNGVRLETKQATSEEASEENKLWIPVTERLPEEHESIFSKFYGTAMWEPLMIRKISDEVLAVVKYANGARKVKTVHTTDGEWRLASLYGAKEVTHWMPLPEAPHEK